MKTYFFVMVGVCVLVIGSTYAYEYTFVNRSDLDAEVQFQLAADIAANFPMQTIKVSAGKGESISIPEWWRAGLCINLHSIRIKFLVAGNSTFKKPLPIYESADFDYIVQTKELPKRYEYINRNRDYIRPSAEDYVNDPTLDSGWAKDGFPVSILCFNRTFDIAYHIKNNHPVIRER